MHNFYFHAVLCFPPSRRHMFFLSCSSVTNVYTCNPTYIVFKGNLYLQWNNTLKTFFSHTMYLMQVNKINRKKFRKKNLQKCIMYIIFMWINSNMTMTKKKVLNFHNKYGIFIHTMYIFLSLSEDELLNYYKFM
jgi:hypothetical protein